VGSTTTSSAGRAAVVAAALLLVACARPYVSPLAPPPHRDEITAGYDAAWAAIVRALAKENVALRAIARDSGVIASDDFVAPIGVYADCGRMATTSSRRGLVSFTLSWSPTAPTRTSRSTRGCARICTGGAGAASSVPRPSSSARRPDGSRRTSSIPCGSSCGTRRMPSRLADLIRKARRLAAERDRLIDGLARTGRAPSAARACRAPTSTSCGGARRGRRAPRPAGGDSKWTPQAWRHETQDVVARLRKRVEPRSMSADRATALRSLPSVDQLLAASPTGRSSARCRAAA